jgi:Glycosyl transferase family 2
MTAPRLTVVVIFFNMRREARRTLWSLTPAYQLHVESDAYEVIAVDNGSIDKLDPEDVRSIGTNFRLVRFESDSPSPAAAINHAAQLAQGTRLMVLIDGARILSPGILHYATRAFEAFDNPFVYALSMHLGHRVQPEAMLDGYDQTAEDQLLATVDWQRDGYELFRIASLAPSAGDGYFSDTIAESNAVALTLGQFEKLGGYDERFRSRGGGLVNLDFFNRALADATADPVLLLGEATFHQFHGGVATNVPFAQHPWEEFVAEYRQLTGRPYAGPVRRPHYLGGMPSQCRRELWGATT